MIDFQEPTQWRCADVAEMPHSIVLFYIRQQPYVAVAPHWQDPKGCVTPFQALKKISGLILRCCFRGKLTKGLSPIYVCLLPLNELCVEQVS